MRTSLILPFLMVLSGCAQDPFGPFVPDLAVNGPPGHPPGRPPHQDRMARAYDGLPVALPGTGDSAGPPTLPGLATETTTTSEVKPEYAVPDAEVSYGSSGRH